MSSVRREVIVEAAADRAFRVFTEKMDTWWPPEHHIGKIPMKNIVLDRRNNGDWYEVGTDGSRCDWGRVLIWDPPRRVVLTWQLTAEWQYDKAFITEVEINFTPLAEGRTRVALEHRNLERYGAKEADIIKSVGSEGGWTLTLQRFAAAASLRNADTDAAVKTISPAT
ncbi:MAG: ATPase [Acidobacteria bacterium]|nr:MAG: ATPase [Acidobacteriota bacterium]